MTFGSIRVGQTDTVATVNVQNAPSGAKLDAWIDFNRDGSWGEFGEQIADGLAVVAGDNAVGFDVPGWAASGDTYAIFRLSTAGNLAPSRVADDGEVEDFLVTIQPQVVSSGIFVPGQVIVADAKAIRSAFAADLDGDGDLDVLAASALDSLTSDSRDKITWYENNGGGDFGPEQVILSEAGAHNVFAADLDGDSSRSSPSESACRSDF